MDAIAAERLIQDLLGKQVGGWSLKERKGSGKSAVVFLGTRGAEQAAVKIFDPALVCKSGEDKQLRRIERELSLKGHNQPNLVKIIDGGKCAETGLLFVVMEFINAPNLAEAIQLVPRAAIRNIVAQIAGAAQFLETREIVHRDIKPDNIAITQNFEKAVLLDLGVIHPFRLKQLADSSSGERHSFVGTLRYSPPEYLFREEGDNLEDWRAVTFYQLGAVLYDLIERKRIFEEWSEPYPRLVEAVRAVTPNLTASDIDEDLLTLAQNCLVKQPELRLSFVAWQQFFRPKPVISAVFNARERLARRLAQKQDLESHPSEVPPEEAAHRMRNAAKQVQLRLHALIKAERANNSLLPPLECREEDGASAGSCHLLVSISLERGARLYIWFTIKVLDAEALGTEILVLAAVSPQTLPIKEFQKNGGASVFKGVFSEPGAREPTTEPLYVFLERALALNNVSNTVWISLNPSEAERA